MNFKYYLSRLQKSKFRSGFYLKGKDKKYYFEKGEKKIKEHARDFVKNRLAPSEISNDGKQTPMRGHPVFIAQHATATCCRGCLEKWYKIEKGKTLSCEEQEFIVNLIMAWIKKEVESEN